MDKVILSSTQVGIVSAELTATLGELADAQSATSFYKTIVDLVTSSLDDAGVPERNALHERVELLDDDLSEINNILSSVAIGCDNAVDGVRQLVNDRNQIKLLLEGLLMAIAGDDIADRAVAECQLKR